MPITPTPSIASELVLLQNDISRKLLAEQYFTDIPVFVVRSKTVEGDIANAINGVSMKQGKSGIAVQVIMPTADCVDQYEKVPGPFFIANYCVRIQEIPLINMGARGTQKTAEEVALNVLNMLHLFNFGRSLVAFRASPTALTPSLEFEPRLTYDVCFHAVYQLPRGVDLRVPTPTADISGATLTLTDSDPDARIYYTAQDTDYPSADAGGILYSTPFTVLVGSTIRAAAYKDGLQSSEVLRLDITP
jgi:hypothetical protein